MSDLLKDLYEKSKSAVNTVDRAVSDTKRKFTDALVEATDLTPADMRKGELYEQQKQERKDVTGNLFDIATPDATAAIGKLTKLGKLGQMMNRPDMISNIVSNAGKVASKGKDLYGKVQQINPEAKQTNLGSVKQIDTAQDKWSDKINADQLKNAYNIQLKKAIEEANKMVGSGTDKLKALNEVTSKYFQNDKLGNPKNDLIQAIFSKK